MIPPKRQRVKTEKRDTVIPNKRLKTSCGRTDASPVKFEDMTRVTPAGTVLKYRDLISSKDLPAECCYGYRVAFIPAIKDICGTLGPWEDPSDADIARIWNGFFPKHQLGASKMLHMVVSKLVGDTIQQWRRNIATKAVKTLNSTLDSLYDNKQKRVEHATWLLGNDEKERKRPFYYRNFKEGYTPTGIFQSPVIATTLAVHLASISRLPEESRLQEYPIGALALTILAVKRALTWASTGIEFIPQTPEGNFSRSNWGDHYRLEGGRYVLAKTSTNVMNVVKRLKDSQWERILTEADKYVTRGRDALRATPEEEGVCQSDFELEDGDDLE